MLIAWIREHNVQRGEHDPALHYYGYDCAFRSWTESTNLISGYLEVVDPGAVEDITTRLNNYTLEDARYVYDFLAANADAYIAQSSSEEYELILRIAENPEPSWQVWYNLDGGKVIIWTHNLHVGNTYLEDSGT
ncbi:MAG: hypothetical protein PVJ64_02390 [Gemmatimonadales bacterium]